MKKLLFTIITSAILFSCERENDNFFLEDNPVSSIDTLSNYSDYILADFGENSLVSISVINKGYSTLSTNLLSDSFLVQFQIYYDILENNVEKSAVISFSLIEHKSKFDTSNFNIPKYKEFPDMVNFFNTSDLSYYNLNNPIEDFYLHKSRAAYQNKYDIDNDIYGFNTVNYLEEKSSEDFSIKIDSIKASPSYTNVEVYYSFKCIGLNDYDDELAIRKGKGKATFL